MRGKHGWIDNLLTVEDLGGHIQLVLDGKRAVLSDAMIGSERITVGAKGRAGADGREGMVYVRWHDLTGALELQGERKNFHITDARARFDAFVPVTTDLPAQGREAKANSDWADAEGYRNPASPPAPHGDPPPAPRTVPSTQVDNAPLEPENPFLNEDL